MTAKDMITRALQTTNGKLFLDKNIKCTGVKINDQMCALISSPIDKNTNMYTVFVIGYIGGKTQFLTNFRKMFNTEDGMKYYVKRLKEKYPNKHQYQEVKIS